MRDLLVAHETELIAPLVRRGLDRAEELLLHARAVVLMDMLEPGRHAQSGLVGRASEHGRIIVAAPQLVGYQVPVDQCVVGCLRSKTQSFQVPPHRLVRMLAPGDVPGDDDAHLLPGKLHAERNHLRLDRGSVLVPVAPGTDFARGRPQAHQRFGDAVGILGHAEFEERHLKQFIAGIAILARRGFIGLDQPPLARVANEGRHRVALEQGLVLLFGKLGNFVVGNDGLCGAAQFGGTRPAIDQADDDAGDHRAEQHSERCAGRIVSQQGMKYFRKDLEKSRHTLQNRFDFLRRRH